MGTTPPQVTAAPPPKGGNCTTRGSDTPATRRKKASCSAKPPSPPAWRTPGARRARRSACERQKPDNRTQGRPRFRYKTLPAHPPSPHIRYKTLPAHPKWPNLALFLHAGRVLYRSHRQEAEQGEFCTEREAELGLATTALQAPEEPQDPAAVQAAAGWQGQHGFAGPPPDKFRMQFDWAKFQQTQKTLQFQRCKFNI